MPLVRRRSAQKGKGHISVQVHRQDIKHGKLSVRLSMTGMNLILIPFHFKRDTYENRMYADVVLTKLLNGHL